MTRKDYSKLAKMVAKLPKQWESLLCATLFDVLAKDNESFSAEKFMLLVNFERKELKDV